MPRRNDKGSGEAVALAVLIGIFIVISLGVQAIRGMGDPETPGSKHSEEQMCRDRLYSEFGSSQVSAVSGLSSKRSNSTPPWSPATSPLT
jgi:hypothetical protein